MGIAIGRGVAFMPGELFFIDAKSRPTSLRFNFNRAVATDVERGPAILAKLVEVRII